MPQPKKPADRRQRGSRSADMGAAVVHLPSVVAPQVASAPLEWRDEVREAWAELWSSPLAGHYRPTDLPALRRLFNLRHRLIVAQAAFDGEPTTLGSMGQEVMSPWAAEMHRLESEVEKLEDRFGLTPMSRLRLGVTYEEGVSLASRNAQLLEQFKAAQTR